MEEDIALNPSLSENLFVSVICILNRVPVFLVGKPGTSKSITFAFLLPSIFFFRLTPLFLFFLSYRMQIIASNLCGKQSPKKFWRQFPAIYIIPYQCSPMSDSDSILRQYQMAIRLICFLF